MKAFLALALGCGGPPRRHVVSVSPSLTDGERNPSVSDALPLGRWHELRNTTPDHGPVRAGVVLWRRDVGQPVLEALETDGEHVWASVDGTVWAFRHDGGPVWDAQVRAQGPVLATAHGPAVASTDGIVAVLDAADGQTRRAWPAGGDVLGGPVAVGEGFAWVTRAGTVVGGSGWVVETGVAAAGGGASDGESLYFGGQGGSLLAVDPAGERWRVSLPGPVIGHPVVNGPRVLCAYAAAAGHSGGISLHDTATGAEVWRWGTGFEPAAPPAWGATILVPDMGGVLRSLDPVNGNELWHTNGQTAYSTTPVVTPLSVFAVEITGRVSRLDPDDGGEVWTTDLASAATGTPVVVGETLVVGLANGSIVGLGSPSEAP